MLGWHISVYRLAQGGAAPATRDAERNERVAVWQTGLGGLDWLDALVTKGDAVDLGGAGYPNQYTARLSGLIDTLRGRPPHAHETWVSGPSDVIDRSKWPGKTTIDETVLAECDPDEWLLVEAWDES